MSEMILVYHFHKNYTLIPKLPNVLHRNYSHPHFSPTVIFLLFSELSLTEVFPISCTCSRTNACVLTFTWIVLPSIWNSSVTAGLSGQGAPVKFMSKILLIVIERFGKR